jgi:hypothetical protein
MNVAYKHLDTKLRVAELTVGQWITVAVGMAIGLAWGLYLSPLGPSLTLMTSVYLVVLPVAATLFANLTEFDPWLLLRSAVAWRRREGRFAPGPGDGLRGYTVREDEQADRTVSQRSEPPEMEIEALWEERP